MSLWDKLFTEKCKEVLHSKHEKYISASLSPRANGSCAREQIAEEYYAQADRIAELEQNLSAYIVELELHKAMIQDLEKQSKQVGVYDGKDLHIYTPQTKPLSDAEIQQISHRYHYTYNPDYVGFAREIEERHGIK